jgi:hypothetical protein
MKKDNQAKNEREENLKVVVRFKSLPNSQERLDRAFNIILQHSLAKESNEENEEKTQGPADE